MKLNQAFLRSFGNPVANLTKSTLLYFNDYKNINQQKSTAKSYIDPHKR